ncbi:hypothetical protein AB0O65_05145 [Microbacterium sp. NPDC077391]|uniref:hypothetical protein n=1 Tax=Microbacterium sp. NPDC077391 TaxID=3154765 RepID=UPI00343591D5
MVSTEAPSPRGADSAIEPSAHRASRPASSAGRGISPDDGSSARLALDALELPAA